MCAGCSQRVTREQEGNQKSACQRKRKGSQQSACDRARGQPAISVLERACESCVDHQPSGTIWMRRTFDHAQSSIVKQRSQPYCVVMGSLGYFGSRRCKLVVSTDHCLSLVIFWTEKSIAVMTTTTCAFFTSAMSAAPKLENTSG